MKQRVNIELKSYRNLLKFLFFNTVAVNVSVNRSRVPQLPYTKAKLLIIFNDKFRVEQYQDSLAATAAANNLVGCVEYSAAPEQKIDVYVPSQVLLSANSCRSYLCNVLHCNLPCIAVDRLALKPVSKAADLAAENVQYHANMGFNIVAELEVIETSTVGDHVSSINDHHNQQQQQQQLQGRPSLRNSRNLQVESSKRLKSRHEWLVTGNGKLEGNCSICLEEFLAGTELSV
ncbi:hypothetical protein FEM48_Zijuj03G0004800 [Ziziphus jujuba var. spinosa]|uniref:Uncharacterized protein n=1 Tax=Ziziphus jujuba var. spinosa TaxID=714518 RepID=A0A978VM53_ZIZJJ|nr:hypothetical protein FEM48_Zijuj03G0004800 [Ziziphus jujuba var. spinosa]